MSLPEGRGPKPSSAGRRSMAVGRAGALARVTPTGDGARRSTVVGRAGGLARVTPTGDGARRSTVVGRAGGLARVTPTGDGARRSTVVGRAGALARVTSTGDGARRSMAVGRLMGLGAIVIVLFFGGFGAWAAFAPLESAAIVQGVLSVGGKRKTVQHLEGGIVAGILVGEGDTVAAGQTLVVLDDTRPRATLSLLEGQYRSAAALKARLEAERDGMARVRYPEWLRRAVETAGAGDFLATQNRIFRARAQSLDNRTAIHRQRIAQLREEVLGLREEIAAQDRQIGLLEEEIGGLRRLVEKGFEGKPRLLALERRQAEVEGERARNRARIARVEQRVGETRLTIAELGNARRNEVVAELREVETRMSDLRERVSAARDVFSRTRITAPVSGTVVDLRVFTRGAVVGRGQPLMDVVPAGDALVIEARVDPIDIDAVYPRLPAQVRLTAFSHLETPILSGAVLGVSADRLIDERTGIPYYAARIALDPDQPALADLELQPGMPAEVMIVTGRRTAFSYLLKPILASFGRALREE